MSKTPSPKQVQFLEARKISVPPTSKAAWRLIGYILKGNATGGATQEERIEILRREQERLVEKTVRSSKWGNQGYVLYISAKTFAEVMNARKMASSSPLPFEAVVRWQGDGRAKAGTRPVSPLDLLVDPTTN